MILFNETLNELLDTGSILKRILICLTVTKCNEKKGYFPTNTNSRISLCSRPQYLLNVYQR